MARKSSIQPHSNARAFAGRLVLVVFLAVIGYLIYEFGRIQANYNIVDAAFALDAILGLDPLPEDEDQPVDDPEGCCVSHDTPSCSDAAVAMCVCADDDFCCAGMWDGGCVAKVEQLGCGQCP